MPVNHIQVANVDGCLHRLLGRLWPGRCLVCGEPSPWPSDLCTACRAALPWNRAACTRCAIPLPAAPAAPAPSSAPLCGDCLQRPPPLQVVRAAFVYGPPLDRLLPRFKFHRDLAAGRLLAQLMVQASEGAVPRAALVPVPLHPKRLRTRGYDQALELARPLARAMHVPLLHDAILRTRHTAPQSRLDASLRRRNLRQAFAAGRAAALPAHVVLVDDVMTTGATLHAAANALLRAGVERVDAWVCARAP